MVRELAAFSLVVLVLALAAGACGAPTGDVPPDSPAAQATNVRRTAVAQVQAIIANNPTATPPPASTPTPTPTCPSAIWWTEARSHLGEARTIQGTVVATRPAPDGAALLEIGQPYPDPTGLAVLVPATAAPPLSGKTVCVAGRIAIAEGRPTIQVRDPAAIVVVN
ncbi:MAG TPA: hypothetical protein VF937_01180 [Chloroflexota bacterium]